MNKYLQLSEFEIIFNFYFGYIVSMKLLKEQNETLKTKIGWETKKIPVFYQQLFVVTISTFYNIAILWKKLS